MSRPSERAAAWAIIPARGGSVGVPGKNLQKVGGHALVARAVLAARGAERISRVFVSTDSDAIAAAARSAGAEIVIRPADISGSAASSESALLHALDHLEAGGHALPPIVAFIQCTSPFVRAQDIDGTVALVADGADSAFAAAESHAFFWRRSADGADGINHDKASRPRRQDREPQFIETGAVYAMNTAGFRTARHRFFGRTAIAVMPADRGLEIDTPADLAVARALAPLLDAETVVARLPWPVEAVVFDFDGVMTDDRVTQLQDGTEAVVCSRADGMGIERLRDLGLAMAVISRESNPVVARRCEKLRLQCFHAVKDKRPALQEWARERGVDLARTIYVGNDINDLPCFEMVGFSVAPADAHLTVTAVADLVLQHRGGRGAVRELADGLVARAAR